MKKIIQAEYTVTKVVNLSNCGACTCDLLDINLTRSGKKKIICTACGCSTPEDLDPDKVVNAWNAMSVALRANRQSEPVPTAKGKKTHNKKPDGTARTYTRLTDELALKIYEMFTSDEKPSKSEIARRLKMGQNTVLKALKKFS